MPRLQDLVTEYPILLTLAEYVSTLDLLNLALTARVFSAHVFPSPAIFARLKRTALCDGRGLIQRQNFEGLYSIHPGREYIWGSNGLKIWKDEPIEVRLYATKCDAANALPCRRCGINICEECRYYRREPERDNWDSLRRPHLNGAWQCENVFALCTDCDEKLEQEMKGKFLHELCTCSVPERWMCVKCIREERQEERDMYARNTHREVDGWDKYLEYCEQTKCVTDHQFEILFWCPCGAFVPENSRLRCTWCKRRHRPEEEWFEEYQQMRNVPRVFEDPCYPPYIGDIYAPYCDSPYPKLDYDGPIYGVS